MMKIGIISDTHDNIRNFDKIKELLKRKEVAILIHCGDYCASFMLFHLESLNLPVHGVFGNGDGDRYLMTKLTYTNLKNIILHGDLGEIEIEGKKIVFLHDQKLAEGLFAKKEYDLVCHGHIHKPYLIKEEERHLICPGEVMGMKGVPSFCVYNTQDNHAEIVYLDKEK
ncbi:YfcE family phosphodiesterase [bacterium]|nr:YfcE family phosphodiesterase [bacterium]MBU0899480.1 YfcE family phosphodiesterase [bacterium]MBU1153245.1 YfcE family phosphodiesterase [bacterium]MBU2599193.1 YfcE family phosphodiesterase [bacterium]